MKQSWIRVATAAVILFVFSLAACSTPPPDRGDIPGTSAKFTVKGSFERIEMNRVDSVAIEDGKFVVHGVGIAKKDVPGDADPSQPAGHWSLTTETSKGNVRTVTFTHDETLDDFQIDLPAGEAEVHYGTLKAKSGPGQVMLLAWGDNNICYWGYVTITPK
jgi:hypothetical protein